MTVKIFHSQFDNKLTTGGIWIAQYQLQFLSVILYASLCASVVTQMFVLQGLCTNQVYKASEEHDGKQKF